MLLNLVQYVRSKRFSIETDYYASVHGAVVCLPRYRYLVSVIMSYHQSRSKYFYDTGSSTFKRTLKTTAAALATNMSVNYRT
eukprot:SAG11_NODE_2311_length_3538_cov_2.702821_4_plen_82_part_00